MMKLTGKLILTMAFSALSLTAFAYDDPQTDYDSVHATKMDSDLDNQVVVDIAVAEVVSRTDYSNERSVDPQTDYDSVHMTDYLENIE